MTEYSINRDRWGRPMLFPPEGGAAQPYVRVSTLAKSLDDKSNLVNWKATMAVMGIMKSKPLQTRVLSLLAKGGGYSAHKTPMKEIVERATDLAGASNAADQGTGVHEFTEIIDSGLDLDWAFVPEDLKGPLDAYAEATSRLKVVATEVFVSIDAEVDDVALRSSGSMDRVYEYEGNFYCGDLKTGANEPAYGLGVTTQVALYAHGHRYRDAKFPGSPPFTDGEANADGTAWRKSHRGSLESGLMVHLPLEKVKGKHICDVYLLDLNWGWRAVEAAHGVRELRKLPKLVKL